MINISENNKQDCCGCWACAQVCPKKCITMIQDKEGFLYPVVDADKCSECEKCINVCPVIQKEKLSSVESDLPKAIGGWHKDHEVLKHSSSGGAFSLFASHIFKINGVVFGPAFDDNLNLRHVSIDNVKDLNKLRGSKYIQSEIGNSYEAVKQLLKSRTTVLFTGTPCQVAGLHLFLGKKYDNLLSLDFICHGVPSPMVFKKYITYLEKKEKSKIADFKFRNKDRNWNPTGQQQGTKVIYKNGAIKQFKPAFFDYFINGFLSDLYLRPSCHECPCKKIPKTYSDLTIADFWGAHKVNKQLVNPEGTSLVLINTEKGEKFFNRVATDFCYEICDYQAAVKNNKCLLKSVTPSKNRNHFFMDLDHKSFRWLMICYMNPFSWAFSVIRKRIFKNA